MAEIIVTSTADSGAGSLRQALTDANDGDVILFDADVFPVGQTTSILLSSQLSIAKNLTIDGDGRVAIDTQLSARCVGITGGSGVISNLTLKNGKPVSSGSYGGGLSLSNAQNYTFNNCTFNACESTSGGGVYINGTGAPIFNDCTFENCSATTSGGGVYATGSSQNTLNDCVMTNCSADAGGGAFLTSYTQNVLNNCTFDDCISKTNGGAVVATSYSINNLVTCILRDCHSTNGGGFYSGGLNVSSLNNCSFDSCTATENGGAAYLTTTNQTTITNCAITNCTATSIGGAIFVNAGTTINNNCTITNCSANIGGGIYFYGSSQNTFNDCTISGCNATNGGGGYFAGTSQTTLNNCVVFDNFASVNASGFYMQSSCIVNINDSTIIDNRVMVLNNTTANITRSTITTLAVGSNSGNYNATANIGGITTINTLQVRVLGSITIEDGAALTVTASASIASGATITSSGRGYLAIGADVSVSSATLTNVVLCAYGADVSSFAEVDGVLEWDADDPSVSVLIEREVNDAWTTLAQTTGDELDYYLPPKVNLRLFDGERFLTTATPDSRTYFYIGGAEGSFDDAEDWSLTKNGTAIPQSPTITDCAFVIQGAEGDVAISKGSADVTGATIIPAGTNDIAVTVDEATVLAGTERFTGTLTTTGDVAINGDASKLAIVVDGTLEVAGSLKLATLTLTSGSNVVFASADDVLVVTGSATVNDATFSCEEPTAYFTAPSGTDLTQATFTNVYVATKGAEVVSVTGSRFGKNYSINIISEDNTLPVTVEYRLEGTTEWIVADPAFVGTTFQIRLDDDATFRVYNGEKFTEATMKVYGLYNEMAAIVEIGYLI